jgi:16S rRNA G966 N2-methylase RsmD
MKKFRIGFEVFGQMVWITVEAGSRTAAQAIAYDKMKKSRKMIKEVVEL